MMHLTAIALVALALIPAPQKLEFQGQSAEVTADAERAK
jgi:hypothetical protein